MSDRFVVDQRGGCVAVLDKRRRDPLENGLDPDAPGVVLYRSGRPVQKTCQCCGAVRADGWMVPPEHVEECRQLAERFNHPTFLRFLRALEGRYAVEVPDLPGLDCEALLSSSQPMQEIYDGVTAGGRRVLWYGGASVAYDLPLNPLHARQVRSHARSLDSLTEEDLRAGEQRFGFLDSVRLGHYSDPAS